MIDPRGFHAATVGRMARPRPEVASDLERLVLYRYRTWQYDHANKADRDAGDYVANKS